MVSAIWIGIIGGLIAGVSPCVLPMLPVVFFAGGTVDKVSDTTAERGAATIAVRPHTLARPLAVVGGLVLSFATLILLGSVVVSTLGLPPGLLRWIGIVLLAVAGLGLIVPRFGELLQRPFTRIPGVQRVANLSPFALGIVLGSLYLPCAGPVLAAIAVAGATNTVDGRIIALTVAFAIGVAIPLLIFAIAGARLTRRWNAVSARGRRVRTAGGLVMVVLAAGTAFGVLDPVVLSVPDYTAAVQGKLASALVPAADVPGTGSPADCESGSATLADCGRAPEIGAGDQWFNTPAPLSLAGLRGKVVIVDFWTLGCINCTRALPYVQDWYEKYRDDGLEVIGVHSPEFDYEHDASRIADTIADRGYTFPVVQDNSFGTWTSYDNSYWPALYLIDASGTLRYVTWGEGNYDQTEAHIQSLLAQAGSSGR